MAAVGIDFEALLRGIPKGAWVAVSEDQERVIAYGFEIQEVLKRARDSGERNPIMLRVPEFANALIL